MYQFRYIYVSDGSRGFLLDLIEGPEAASLRLLWCNEGASSVLRAPLRGHPAASDGEHAAASRDQTRRDQTSFSDRLATSRIPGLEYEIHFDLEAASERFGPSWVPRVLPRVPEFHSQYGRLTQATVLDVSFGELPLGYSWYSVKNLVDARWLLVSALEFSGTDLRIELCAIQVAGNWLGAVVFRYQGVSHRLNGLSSTWRVSVVDPGTAVNGARRFGAEVSQGELRLELEAEAPLTDFALLEDHGATQIQTTLFGTCQVRVRTSAAGAPVTYQATRTCLLELKS